MSAIKIDKDVPLVRPNQTGEGARKYPFNEMEVGHSFLINGRYDPKKVRQAAYGYAKVHRQKFAIRKTPEGLRCWRIA